MIAELYDALKEAGASEEKSRAAAKAIAVNQMDVRCVFSIIRNRDRFAAEYRF
jgi:hypothetical protein